MVDRTENPQPEPRGPGGLLVRAKRSGGAFAMLDYEIPPLTLAAPLHTHANEDEYSYVARGRLGVRLDDEDLELAEGRMLAKPSGLPHTLWNPTPEPVQVLELIAPAGFERCLAEVHAPGGPPEPGRLSELWAQYGIEMQPDTVPGLLERHGLRSAMLD